MRRPEGHRAGRPGSRVRQKQPFQNLTHARLCPRESSETEKPKKTLPLFGAMKGGSKFKLKTGTIGVGWTPPLSPLCSLHKLPAVIYTPSPSHRQKLPPKRPSLPAELFDLKASSPGGGEEEEEEDDDEEKEESIAEKMQEDENGSGDVKESTTEINVDCEQPSASPDGTKGK